IGPGAGQAIKDLAAVHFGAIALILRQLGQRFLVGDGTPQPGRHRIFFDLLEDLGDAGLAEVFLRNDVGRNLRPGCRHGNVFQLEHYRSIRIADFAGRGAELERGVAVRVGSGKPAFYAHGVVSADLSVGGTRWGGGLVPRLNPIKALFERESSHQFFPAGTPWVVRGFGDCPKSSVTYGNSVDKLQRCLARPTRLQTRSTSAYAPLIPPSKAAETLRFRHPHGRRPSR